MASILSTAKTTYFCPKLDYDYHFNLIPFKLRHPNILFSIPNLILQPN